MQKKKIAMIIIAFIVLTVFFTSNKTYPTNADTKSFTLKDGFETYIENKIYSQEENLTITEYFKDYYGDSCDFEEDIEGFNFQYQSGCIAYSISKFKGNLQLNVSSDLTASYFTLMYRMDNENLSLIHYDYLEVSAKCDNTDYNPTISFGSKPLVGFEYFPTTAFPLTDTFQTFYCKIDINQEYYENVSNFLLLVKDTGISPIDYEFFNFEVEYIKIWRNNVTDYATEEIGDSWDFSEGDNEDIQFDGVSNVVVENGYVRFDCDSIYDGMRLLDLNLDVNNYNYNIFVFRGKANYTTNKIYICFVCSGMSNLYFFNVELTTDWTTQYFIIPQQYISSVDEITVKMADNWDDTYPIRIFYDYFLLKHNNLEDKVFYQSQNTSFYRASTGLYSYHHNFTKGFIPYDNFYIPFNSCVIIDIPSMSMFPQRIDFQIYSNSYFNISLFIGTEEFILYEKTNTNSWLSIRRTINRENYLINETETELYFKIYTENQQIQNYLEYYIDNLDIVYTEAREIFEYSYDTSSGDYLDYFNIDATGNFFHSEPSGVNPYCFDEDSRGLEYNTTSNTLFSRRLYHTYKIENSEVFVGTYAYQYTTFNIDKEYLIVSKITVFHYFYMPSPPHDYLYSEIVLTNYLYIDGINQNINNTVTIIDTFITGLFDFQYMVNIAQEDYDTMSMSSYYINTYTGNNTKTANFAFNINEGDIKTTLNTLQVFTSWNFYAILLDADYLECNPYLTLKIGRDITHTDPTKEGTPVLDIPKFPEWDEDHPFLSFFAFCIWFPVVFVQSVLEIFYIGNMVTTISDGIAEGLLRILEVISNLGNIIISLGEILTSLLSSEGLLGSILAGIGAIGTGIANLVSNVGNIWDWISNFFANIVSPFGDFWDGFLGDFGFIGGAWGNLMDGFKTGDWGDMPTLWGSMFPAMNISFINLWKNAFSGFYIDFFGWDFVSLIDVVKDFFAIIGMVITILIVIYLIHLFKLAGTRDWDRLRLEISGIIGILVWIVTAIVKIIHWIFEVIWALLDVLIPFT